MHARGTSRKSWTIAITGCAAVILLSVLGEFVVSARTVQGPTIDHFVDVLAAGGIPCLDGQFWSAPPKGQSTLNCDDFEIDTFNNNEQVAKFLYWKVKPADVTFLRRSGQKSFIVRGPTWVLLTPSLHTATELRSRVGGRLVTISG